MKIPFLDKWANRVQIIKNINAINKRSEKRTSIRGTGKGLTVTQTENGTSITLRDRRDVQIKRVKITTYAGAEVAEVKLSAADGTLTPLVQTAFEVFVQLDESNPVISRDDIQTDDIYTIVKLSGFWYLFAAIESIEVITDFRIETSFRQLQVKRTKIVVMAIGEESDWEVVHTGTECT